MKGYMYILKCSDDSYYTGSTKDLERRLQQHQNGEGANHTKKGLPVKLMYFEEFDRIDEAFYREKQIQGWSRKKKEALITNNAHKLPDLSMAYRDVASSTSATEVSSTSATEVSSASATEVSSTSATDVLSTSAIDLKKEINKEPLPKKILTNETLPEALEGKQLKKK